LPIKKKENPKSKKAKEKPLYNVGQNTAYVLGKAWERDRQVIVVIAVQIILAVAISTVSIFMPRAVVAQITGSAEVSSLVLTVVVFSAAIMFMQMAKAYFTSLAFMPRLGLRIATLKDMLMKTLVTDYANLEYKKFTDAKQKAQDQTNNNSTSTEQIYYTYERLGTNLLGFFVYMILLVSVNPLVLLITAATTVIGALVRRRADRWQHDHDSERAGYGKRIWYITDIGQNYAIGKDLRLFGMVGWLRDVYAANLKLIHSFHRRAALRHILADAVECAAAFSREGLAYGYLIYLVLYNGMPADRFVLLFAAIGGFSGWIYGILTEYSTLTRDSLNFCRVREFLEFPDMFKRGDGEPIAPEAGKPYSLELRDVTFRYSGADENVLENVNLKVEAGKKLAIVGLNGAGKTTIVKLLCGFYDPTEGAVLLNGKDIRDYNRKCYYGLFTAVFQEFNILPMTIAQNISQKTGDEIDFEKISRVLRLADLDKKIDSLPNKLDSLLIKSVHEDAVELSGGETQRLMLSRALYKDSPILILDEPTAALDPIAESALYNRYNELSAGKTSVYISHRLASTRFCDHIVLIAGKNIAEQGDHEGLMSLGGRYAELFGIQSKYYKEGAEGGQAI